MLLCIDMPRNTKGYKVVKQNSQRKQDNEMAKAATAKEKRSESFEEESKGQADLTSNNVPQQALHAKWAALVENGLRSAVTVKLVDEVDQMVEYLAKRTGRQKSDIVNEALTEKFAKERLSPVLLQVLLRPDILEILSSRPELLELLARPDILEILSSPPELLEILARK
jgi:hypothetical protein